MSNFGNGSFWLQEPYGFTSLGIFEPASHTVKLWLRGFSYAIGGATTIEAD